MNVLLWIVQIVLALFFVAGGAYKITATDALATMAAMPPLAWRLLGVLEVAGGLLLVVPGLMGRLPGSAAIAATVLLVESIGLSTFYASYSTTIAATNPLVWTVLLTVLTAVVAIGRFGARRSA